jgi:hypothetical protein
MYLPELSDNFARPSRWCNNNNGPYHSASHTRKYNKGPANAASNAFNTAEKSPGQPNPTTLK